MKKFKFKWLLLSFILSIASINQAWAASEGGDWRSASSAKVYFDNTNSSYSNVSMLIGRQWTYDSDKIGSWGEDFTKISGTNNLYYKSISCSHYTTFAFIDATGWGWKENEKVTDRLGYCTNTNTPNDQLGSDTHLYVPASGSDGASVTHTTPSSYTGLNYTQTLNQKLSTDGGSTFSTSTAAIATVKVQSKKLNGNSSTTDDSGTISSGSSSTSCAAARTATVTYTVSSVATGYEFVGWYDGNTQKSTEATYTYNATAAKTITARFKETQYSLTFSHNGNGTVAVGGSTISAGSTANVNHITTKTLVATANTGYRFTGWTVTGTNNDKVTIADKTSTGTSTTIKATGAGATVTAGFTKKTYSIILGKGDGGDSNGSATIQRGDGALTITSHASKDGWNLVGYWTSGGAQLTDEDGTLLANVSSYTDEDGHWIYDDDATLTAHWSQTYSLTVNAGSNISSVTGSNADVTLNSKYAISATPNTGYSFSGWTALPVANGTFDDASSASTNVTVKNGSVTVTGAATENMTTVTVNVSPAGYGTLTLDASAFTPGNTTTAGVTTKRTVVATANSGKVFHNWTVTGNATGSASTNTYTLEGNGSAGAGTLTANFGVASGWYMYGNAPWGNTWDKSKATAQLTYPYRGMSGVYYIPTTIAANKYFRITNKSSELSFNSSTSSDFAFTKGTIYSLASNTVKATYSTTNLGDVWVVVNTNGTTKKAWVQSAQTFYNVNLSGVDNAKGPVAVTLKTTSAFTKGTNTFTTTQYANGETFTVTVTGVSGYIPTITIGDNTPVTWWKEQTTYTADGTMGTSDVTVTISYTPTRAVTFAKTTGCSTLSATGPSSTAVTTGTKVKDGTVIRFAQTNTTGYTFSKWYSNNTGSGGTQYSTSSSAYDLTISSTAYTIYPLYTENMTTVNLIANPTGKGTFTSGGTVTSVSAGVTTHPTVTAVPGTGYHLTGTIWSESSSYISLSATNTASTTITATGTTGNEADLTATFTPNTYQVQFHRNGGAGDVVYQDFTYDVAQNLTANTYTKTGYNFAGWALTTDGAITYADGANVSNLTTTNEGTFHLYAKWSAKSYTVMLDVEEENHGTIAGATTSQTVYYDGATTTVPNRPTAAQGYALDGYYTDQAGEGLKVINGDGTWIASVSGYTDGSKHWKHDGDVTLYAYYKKAEITNLVLSATAVAPSTTGITATPTISPTPTGTTVVCYELQYSNGTALPDQSSLSVSDNVLTFTAPAASATYRIEAKLRLDDCDGTVLDTRYTTFQVAGEHTVTIKYQDADGRTLRDTTHVTARPLSYSDAITAPTIVGYTFHHWVLGDGITLKAGQTAGDKDTPGTATINIYASYAGTLTAVYTKKNILYFNNTLGWEHVYVYFYSDGNYWDSNHNTSGSTSEYVYGSGAKTTKSISGTTPYSAGKHGEMTRIPGTNIFYFDYTAASISHSNYVTFTKDNQHGYEYFDNTEVVRLADAAHYFDKPGTMPMYVPLKSVYENRNKHSTSITKYYTEGYWMNYPENTGYTLFIYNGTTYGTSDKLQEIPFEFSEDMTLPMSLNVELNAGRDYGFEIHRADGTVLGNNSYTMKSGSSGDTGQTTRTLTTSQRSKIRTASAGVYVFKLDYGNSSGYKYLMGVHYPVALNDYRVVYTDRVAWSGDTHAAGYWHPSPVIHKENGAKDIVSFYVSKETGASAAMKFQYASAINASTGAVTWTDVAEGAINLSSISKTGVYNFHLTQSAGAISVEKIEAYTGNYYIRTDCAGSSKWEYYQDHDHQMTYSDYAETNSGYSHYFCHWITTGTNVKFTIANDYSPCISDTLVADYGTVIAGIDSYGFLTSANANIRFMWNQSTNKLSRAYIGGSGTITDRFLVLEGDSKMFDENGNALTGVYQDHDKYGNKLGTDNQVIMHDDENFVYERTIKVNATARAKLTAKYNTNVQYFKGSSGAFDDEHTVQLLGGTYSAGKKYSMRIVYDFKTNRLVTAYLPEGEIDDPIAINADLMIIREHQEDGQQIIFTGDGALSSVKTVYGVMRFNRWTLNNKSTAAGHAVLGDPKSSYERGLYWISFPFDVNLSDVFGFGTYGVDWIIEYYDGAERASKGYWKDSDGFWKYVMPAQRSTYVLEAGKGYVLALDLARMKDDNKDFWTNNIEQIELFFPSTKNVDNISEVTAHTTVDSHACTIDRRTDKGVTDINKDRTKADSHWNIIGIPSYANYGTTVYSNEGLSEAVTWHSSPYTNDLPFLYEYELVDNTYTVHSGTTYPFKAMHAYMVQYHGDLYWKLASATTPSSIVARRTYAEKPQSVEFRLELQQNDKRADQTFVKLSDDEEVSADFAFNEDLCKEYNSNKANIYTFIEGYIPAAGNILPMTEQTTVVPVGVKIMTDGEYTFAIPDGTEGIGVTLIDNETGERTNLGLTDYTISLEAGTYDERFALEISPVKQTPTGVELLNGENGENGVRKVMIDGILYIVKDGKVFDARGSRVK